MSLFSILKFVLLILSSCWIAGSVFSKELNNHPSSGSNDDTIGTSYFFYQQPQYPRDCTELESQCLTRNISGVHLIRPDGYPEPFEVYCDNTADLGGWTVIHRLQDGSVIFNRNWTEYKIGFGFLSQEFWIGNDKLSFLTNQNTYELRIDLTSDDGQSFIVKYNRFRISDEYSEYILTSVGDYNGTEDEINRFFCPQSSESAIYTSSDCSQRCYCAGGQLTCDDTYQCSSNAVCEERNNGSRCYCNEGYKGDGVNCTIDTPPSNCQDIYDRVSTESGVYKLNPTTWQGDPFDVYCNMTDGGGWTVFQRRIDGSQTFYLNWLDYKNGFGTADHEFWLGNDKLYSMTAQRSYQLRIDIVNKFGAPYYSMYNSFRINGVNDNYRLSVGGYSGTAGNYLNRFSGHSFSTPDSDNDGNRVNCALHTYPPCGSSCTYNAGWWYSNSCGPPPNGPYGTDCFYWGGLPGSACNIKYMEMKVRPI